MAGIQLRSMLLMLAGAGCVLIITALFFSGGPKYHGRRFDGMDGWAAKLRQGTRAEEDEALAALREKGAAAVPTLVAMLEKEDPPLKLKILRMADGRLPFLERWWPPLPLYYRQFRGYAASALGEIGPAASNAIPALLHRSTNNLPFLTPNVTAALMKIRGEPIAPSIKILEDPDSPKFEATARIMGEFGTNGRAAIPALCRALEAKSRAEGSNPGMTRGITQAAAKNLSVCLSAAEALGRIHSDPEVCVPALIRAVENGEEENSVWALEKFEQEAAAAVPVLRRHLQSKNAMVRSSILDALARILPPEELQTLVPDLVAATNSADPNLRATGEYLLKSINSGAAAGAK